ncbi:MAG: hypothetical protein WA843_00650 [Candidatus Saccharimonadales bacterium]
MRIESLDIKKLHSGLVATYGTEVLETNSRINVMSTVLVSPEGLPITVNHRGGIGEFSEPLAHLLVTWPQKPINNEHRLVLGQQAGKFEQPFDVLKMLDRNPHCPSETRLTKSRLSQLVAEHSLGHYVLAREVGVGLSEVAAQFSLDAIRQHGLALIREERHLGQIDHTLLEQWAQGTMDV